MKCYELTYVSEDNQTYVLKTNAKTRELAIMNGNLKLLNNNWNQYNYRLKHAKTCKDNKNER